ncbi:hypothetical protein BDI4_970007 [Burkholderia diffusa]|nr:hypothetical protein BDI4_970007 [Burkholderia diffusa]
MKSTAIPPGLTIKPRRQSMTTAFHSLRTS